MGDSTGIKSKLYPLVELLLSEEELCRVCNGCGQFERIEEEEEEEIRFKRCMRCKLAHYVSSFNSIFPSYCSFKLRMFDVIQCSSEVGFLSLNKGKCMMRI